MTITRKATIVSSITLATILGMAMGAVLRPAQAEKGNPAEILCRPTDTSSATAPSTTEVENTPTPNSSAPTTTTDTTTNNSHSNNNGIVTGNDVLSHIKVGDVNVLNDASVLNNADVDVLNNTTATVSNLLNGTVKTVVDVL